MDKVRGSSLIRRPALRGHITVKTIGHPRTVGVVSQANPKLTTYSPSSKEYQVSTKSTPTSSKGGHSVTSSAAGHRKVAVPNVQENWYFEAHSGVQVLSVKPIGTVRVRSRPKSATISGDLQVYGDCESVDPKGRSQSVHGQTSVDENMVLTWTSLGLQLTSKVAESGLPVSSKKRAKYLNFRESTNRDVSW